MLVGFYGWRVCGRSTLFREKNEINCSVLELTARKVVGIRCIPGDVGLYSNELHKELGICLIYDSGN